MKVDSTHILALCCRVVVFPMLKVTSFVSRKAKGDEEEGSSQSGTFGRAERQPSSHIGNYLRTGFCNLSTIGGTLLAKEFLAYPCSETKGPRRRSVEYK